VGNSSTQLLVLPCGSGFDSDHKPLTEMFEHIEMLVPEVAHFTRGLCVILTRRAKT
jgi:hypothetical protein